MRQYKTLIIGFFFLSIFLFKINDIVKDYSLLGKVNYIDLVRREMAPGIDRIIILLNDVENLRELHIKIR